MMIMVIIFLVGRVGGCGGNVFDMVDFYVSMGKGMEGRLGIGVGGFGIVICERSYVRGLVFW